MRKIFLFLLPAVMLFAAGCKDKNGADDVNALTVNPELITCPATGGDYELTVSSPNGAWTATPSESWIRVTPASGEQGSATIRVKISVNKESVASKGSIVFKSGEETVELPVSRAAKAAPYLRIVSEKELNTPKEGGTYTVQVESNIKWSASSNAGWAKVNKGVTVNNDNITITVDAATMPQETMAAIVVKPYGEGYEAGSDTVFITRGSTDATSLTVDQPEVKAPENGGSYTVNVSSNASWRVYKTWDMDWVTVSGSAEGTGNGSFSFSVEAATSMDAVSGILTIEEVRSDNYKPVKTQVYIERAGKAAASLSVMPTTINAPVEGGEFPVYIQSNYPWTADIVGAKIFSVSTKSGDGDATMIVSVKPATDTNEATGSITIRSSFGGEQARVIVHRSAMAKPELDITPTQIDASFEGGTYTVQVKSNYSWTVTSSNSRVAKPETTSGTGNGSFEITVYSTDEPEDATANISVMTDFGKFTKAVTVNRTGFPRSKYQFRPFSIGEGKTVYISPGNLQYNPENDKWRFAEHQFDRIMERNKFRYEETHSSEYWTDMFLWGTGNDPMRKYGQETLGTFVDWGVNPIISPDGDIWNKNIWRTPTMYEWKALIGDKEKNYIVAIHINDYDIWGYVILPDNYIHPEGLQEFNKTSTYPKYNVYDWMKIEEAGAVFLPLAGHMENAEYDRFDFSQLYEGGYYWTQSYLDEKAYLLKLYIISPFQNKGIYDLGTNGFGCSVRLIRDAN